MKKVIRISKTYGWAYSFFIGNATILLLFLLLTFPFYLKAQIIQTNSNAIYSTADVIFYDSSSKKEDTLVQKISNLTNTIYIIDADIICNLESDPIKLEPYKNGDTKQIKHKALITKNTTSKKTKNNGDTHSIINELITPNSSNHSFFNKTEQTLSAIQNYSKNKIIFTTQKHTTDKIAASIVVKKYHITRFISITDAVTSSIRPPPFKT